MSNPFKLRDVVQRKTGGPKTEVVKIDDHWPVDGPRTKDAICYLEDGGWEFYWNLLLVGRYTEVAWGDSGDVWR